MDLLKAFDINIAGLSPGMHEFNFEVKDTFFESYEYSIVEKGRLGVKLGLDNRETFLLLAFHIKGSIELTCDRSLEVFDYDLDLHEKMILKYGVEAIDDEEDIETIDPGTARINVADYIYEYITIAVPMKKVHPQFADESDEGEHLFYTSGEDASDDMEKTESVWDQLKKLKE